ncbi:DNA-directed RNA polymerase II subunit GRINL1A [Sciurus carolinensis]|uniref:DNA-directed RNA polymerase II subunit GRINL1A n=1 Tax=Sciurus carolinensis TaxID=30640 RepID=A0AA41MHV4_SCICA|nr:DNA-directed RNA polymerase II subunit GRINL1A [Sciurus carolinensis]
MFWLPRGFQPQAPEDLGQPVPRSRCLPRIPRQLRGPQRKLTALRRASLKPRRMFLLPRGFQPQAPEDLGQRSSAELGEMLKRQERLSRNEKFICRLPDKGKKILDTVAKLKAAIAEREEVRGKRELFHSASLDCKLRQKVIARVDVDIEKAQNSDRILDTSSLVPGCSFVDNIKSSNTISEKQGLVHPTHKGDEEIPETEYTVNKGPASHNGARGPSSPEAREPLPRHCVSSQAEDISSSFDNLFIDKFQRFMVADQGIHHSEENTSAENLMGLSGRTPKKPHYMEVLEMRAKNPVPPPHKFKTNVLPSQQNDSPSHSQREMQAKLAAQKLAERLNIKMQSYNPEGESSGKYREVRDEDDDQSSDDEL